MFKGKKIIILCLLGVFVLTGCTLSFRKKVSVDNDSPINQNTNNEGNTMQSLSEKLAAQSKIKKFENYDELKEFLENNANNSYPTYGGGVVRTEIDAMMEKTIAAPTASREESFGFNETTVANKQASDLGTSAGSAQATNDYSKTNVQVEGVDEADIIKTDGTYIYAVARNALYITKAHPADQAEVISKIDFKVRPTDIYVSGNYLVIYGDDNRFYERDLYKTFKRRSNFVFLKIFDISDKKNPKQVRDLDIEGNVSNSRMIGDYVYFVTNNYNYYYIPDEPIVPRVIDNGKVLSNVCESDIKCFAPAVYYFDMPYDNYNFTTVTAINVRDVNSAVKGEVYMLSGSQNMYVSQNNIYITYTKYVSEYDLQMAVIKDLLLPRLSVKDQDKIRKIEATENFILSPSEKMAKIAYVIERFRATLSNEEQRKIEDEVAAKIKEKYQDISKELEKTVIHKIGINQDKLEYKTVGEVTGSVLNQFSMDENNGLFRIATTKNRTWSQYMDEKEVQSYSNLYILDENLKVMGSLENLAQGERIYSVRFMQNRAYLVTFQQTDPLFVIDLANPRNPKVLGKLKIPGFSNYLHPYDDTTLIGIGKDTAQSEWGGVTTKGLKLSLFDVSDVANPKEVDTYVMGDMGSDSIALNDHKAFLFSREKNLLVIPVSIRESMGSNKWGNLTFSGAAVFTVRKDGFELKGKIDHSDSGKQSAEDYWGGYQYYDNTVKRSLYINDTLYTFSNNYLKANNLNDLSLIKNLPLIKEKSGPDNDFDVIN